MVHHHHQGGGGGVGDSGGDGDVENVAAVRTEVVVEVFVVSVDSCGVMRSISLIKYAEMGRPEVRNIEMIL